MKIGLVYDRVNKIGGATRQTSQPRNVRRSTFDVAERFCELQNMAYNLTSESSVCIRSCQ